MSNLQIYLLGLAKLIKFIWPVLIYIIVGLILIRKWEKDEDERVEKAIEKRNAKRVYCDTNVKEF